MNIIDGKAIANQRLERLKNKIPALPNKPKLVAVIVGDNPASEMYVRMKKKRAEEIGFISEIISVNANTSKEELLDRIIKLNNDNQTSGILVQLPLPPNLSSNQNEILDIINPSKDVDCLTSVNMGLLSLGKPRFFPATVKAILIALSISLGLNPDTLSESNDKYILAGKNITVVGRSDIVGKPLAISLINLGGTVTICNSKTENLKDKTSSADILISAAGSPALINSSMVKTGAIVIDAGINAGPDGKTVGDVDFVSVSKIASAITPVPGGIGPLTICCLLENTVPKNGV